MKINVGVHKKSIGGYTVFYGSTPKSYNSSGKFFRTLTDAKKYASNLINRLAKQKKKVSFAYVGF